MTLGPIPGSWADRRNRVEARYGWTESGGSQRFGFDAVLSTIVGAVLVGAVFAQLSGIDPSAGRSV